MLQMLHMAEMLHMVLSVLLLGYLLQGRVYVLEVGLGSMVGLRREVGL